MVSKLSPPAILCKIAYGWHFRSEETVTSSRHDDSHVPNGISRVDRKGSGIWHILKEGYISIREIEPIEGRHIDKQMIEGWMDG